MWSAIWTSITGFFGGIQKDLIAIAIIAVILVVGFLYWEHLESKISTLQQQNTLLTSTVKTQDQTITQLQKRFAQVQQDLNDLNKAYLTINQNATKTDQQFEYGAINTANKKTVETNINQSYNTIFTNITKQSTTFSTGS